MRTILKIIRRLVLPFVAFGLLIVLLYLPVVGLLLAGFSPVQASALGFSIGAALVLGTIVAAEKVMR